MGELLIDTAGVDCCCPGGGFTECPELGSEEWDSCPEQLFPAISNYQFITQVDGSGQATDIVRYDYSFTWPFAKNPSSIGWTLQTNPAPPNGIYGPWTAMWQLGGGGDIDSCIGAVNFPPFCTAGPGIINIGCDTNTSEWVLVITFSAGNTLSSGIWRQPINGCPSSSGWVNQSAPCSGPPEQFIPCRLTNGDVSLL
jgi:hypothetical protein